MRTTFAFLLLATIAPLTHAQSMNSVNPALVASVANSPQVASLLQGQSTVPPALASIIQTAMVTATTSTSSTPTPTNAPSTSTNMGADSAVFSTAILSVSVLFALLF